MKNQKLLFAVLALLTVSSAVFLANNLLQKQSANAATQSHGAPGEMAPGTPASPGGGSPTPGMDSSPNGEKLNPALPPVQIQSPASPLTSEAPPIPDYNKISFNVVNQRKVPISGASVSLYDLKTGNLISNMTTSDQGVANANLNDFKNFKAAEMEGFYVMARKGKVFYGQQNTCDQQKVSFYFYNPLNNNLNNIVLASSGKWEVHSGSNFTLNQINLSCSAFKKYHPV